jgi:hypothetical protein
VPSLMTLTVVGDFDREAVLAKIDETFATLPERPAPQRDRQFRDPQRYRQSIYWQTRANVYYENGYKFYQATVEDQKMLLFLRALLDRRLGHKLRFGEKKAVYGIWVGVSHRGPATYFSIRGEIKKEKLAYARDVIEQELEALRTGTLPDDEFDTERLALARQLRVNNAHADNLGWWVAGHFYDPELHHDFPDLIAEFELITKQEVAEFLRKHFVPEHQVRSMDHPLPVNQAVLVFLPIILWWGTVKLARRMFIRPVDMTRIRYVARFKIPVLYALFLITLFGTLSVVIARLIVYGYWWMQHRFVIGLDNFWMQSSTHGIAFIVSILGGIWLLSRIPYKLLVFEDHVRVKYLFYRSQQIMPDAIVEIVPCRFREVWGSRKLWKCVALTIGLVSPGLYLRLRNGWAYFFRVRQNDECRTVFQDLISRTSQTS